MDLRNLGKNPIAGESPAGQDIRSDADFEALREEIRKLSSPTATSPVNWERVQDLAQTILAEKSKHLLVALYLTQALLVRQGLSGFATGIGMLRELLENFWPTLYPPLTSLLARVSGLVWWRDRVVAEIAKGAPESWSSREKESLLQDLRDMESFLHANLKKPFSLQPLIAGLQEALSTVAAATTPPKAQAAPVASAPEKSPALPADATPEQLIKAGMELLNKATVAWTQKDDISAFPFLLNRVAAWLELQKSPNHTDGVTQLPAPPLQVARALETLFQQKNWRDLLQAAEARVREYFYWLDLGCYVSEALNELGYDAIADMVAAETANFVRRLPGLENLSFSDGTPFANEETKAWLEKWLRKPSSEAPAPAPPGAANSHIAEFFKEAAKLARGNKLPQVLAQFKEKRNQSPAMRERLLWDLGLCQFLLRSKASRLALPYARGIFDTLQQFEVEIWDPELAAEALTVALAAIKKHGGSEANNAENQRLFEAMIDRLSVLDPKQAMDYL